jgi:hypothetical protein
MAARRRPLRVAWPFGPGCAPGRTGVAFGVLDVIASGMRVPFLILA